MVEKLPTESRDVVNLVPGRTDKEIADDLRKRLTDAFAPLCSICDEAHREGMQVAFQIGLGPTGRHQLLALNLLKTL